MELWCSSDLRLDLRSSSNGDEAMEDFFGKGIASRRGEVLSPNP